MPRVYALGPTTSSWPGAETFKKTVVDGAPFTPTEVMLFVLVRMHVPPTVWLSDKPADFITTKISADD